MAEMRDAVVLLAKLTTLAIAALGCVSMPVQRSVPSQTDYVAVDYRRFVSGLYVNELKNKFVKMDSSFAMVGAGVPSGYSTNYMTFFVTRPVGFRGAAPGMLTVVAPKSFADVVFSLRNGDQIEISGRAIESVHRGARGSVARTLFLQADRVQRSQEVQRRDGPQIY